MNETPRANRTHIAIFGRANSGKSSFINALTNQQISLVSEQRGTTTDPVYKSMELHPLGPCVLIDTAGFDDETLLVNQRIEATKKVIDKTDIAIVLFAEEDIAKEKEWLELLSKSKIPTVALINKMDLIDHVKLGEKIKTELGIEAAPISALEKINIELAREKIVQASKVEKEISICGHLVSAEDVVLLVMPQDIQAPKGRLILPQVQTIRDLLDNRCIVLSATVDNLKQALDCLKNPPKLIITDSQVFPIVRDLKPVESQLTSFSVLFSRYKGDVDLFIEGAKAMDNLQAGDKVVIAEACTHNPQDGDIGRIKIPAMLRKKYGELDIEVVSGADFPESFENIKLVIHCGGCMFNRKHVMSRIEKAQKAGVPITNYGIAIAYMNNMMDSITH